MSIRPSIPEVQGVRDPKTAEILLALKNAVEMITGRGHKQKPLTQLGEDANFYGIVQKINEIVVRLQSETDPARGGFGNIATPTVTGVPGPTQTTTLTGDVTGSGTTGITTTLATITTASSAGAANLVPVIVWDAKGRVTTVTTATVTPGAIGAVSTSTVVVTGTATLTNATVSGVNTGDQTITLSGDVLGTGSGAFAATLVSTFAGGTAVGSGSTVPVVTWDAKGRITALSTATITSTAVGGLSVAGVAARVSMRV